MQPSTIYSNAIIAVYTKSLLTVPRIRRMIGAPSFADCARILTECGWDDATISHNTNNEDAIINNELTRTINTFCSLCPDENIVACALAPFTNHNTSVPKDATEAVYNFTTAIKLPKPQVNKIKHTGIRKYFETENINLLKSDNVFDLSQVLYWFIIKQRELKIVKVILMGKKLDLSREQIRELLRTGGLL